MPILREGRCLYLTITDEHHWLTVWPSGTTIDQSADPPVIRAGIGNRITSVGAYFTLSGTSFDASRLDDVRPYLERDIPEGCLGTELLLIDPGVSALRPRFATWRLNPANLPDPTSSTLHIEIHENACSDRRDPTGRTLPPEVVYGADEIVITMSISEIGGRCPGNTYFPMTIELTQPIGDRSLVDGYDSGVRWTAAAQPTPVPTATPPVVGPPTSDPSIGIELAGVLVRASLDGNCGYVLDDDGETWEVHWPHYVWTEGGEDPVLHDPTQFLAVAGARLSLRGHLGDDARCGELRVFHAAHIVEVSPTPKQSPEDRAVMVALTDPLLADYVNNHSQLSFSVDLYNPPGSTRRSMLVTLDFEGLADDYPLDACDVAHDGNRIYGVAWLLDESGTDILARSPVWRHDIRCF